MSMNPRETTDKIRKDYQDYVASILTVKDTQITNLAHKAVKDTEFVKGPYLETTLPFVDGKSLKELAESGLISKEFSKMGKAVHYEDWKLRIHQEKALRHIIEEKRNMVVSTGTGSGKTECYLYPIFNELMREKEAGTLGPGVRALLIFPMNALANDQQKKLRKILRDYPNITFGRYTGETERKHSKESPQEAEIRLHDEYDIAHSSDTDEVYRKSIKNEIMCREMMAERPPHILLTNYAMLEYMLLQPDTAPFFDTDSASHWRFIVIDEAHTYKGANGTEIAYLLRRVKERIRHHMDKSFRCIATSATLGSNDEAGLNALAQFATNLFDEEFTAGDIITTTRIERQRPKSGRSFSGSEYKQLKKAVEGLSESERGTFLYERLRDDLRLFDVYEALKGRPLKIDQVASSVFEDLELESEREESLIDLIEVAAAAKKSDFESALLPARYHLFVKSLEGMFAQFYPQKTVYLDRKEKSWAGNKVYSVFELANCQKCAQEYLVGRTLDMDNGTFFVQTSSSDRPEFYFISNDTEDNLTSFDEDDEIDEKERLKSLERFHLCLCCGRITPFAEKHPANCCDNSDSKKIVSIYKLGVSGKDNEANCCPCCGATRKGLIRRFLTANQPATFAVAKSLYDAIPPRPLNAISQSFDDPFEDDPFADDFDDNRSIMPGELLDESGRKLLIFSDNRQEAAFFAGFFEKKYNLIMWRKVILNCLKEAPSKSLCLPDLITRVTSAAEKAGLYAFDFERKSNLTDDQKSQMASLYIMQEFINPEIGTGLEGMGFIQVMPEEIKLKDSTEIAGLHGEDLWNLIRFMLDTLREKGACNYPEPIRATNDFLSPKNHAGYFRYEGTKIERTGHTYGFVPKAKSPNKRLGMMLKLIDDQSISTEAKNALARENLKKVYELILRLVDRGYIVQTSDSNNGIVYQMNYMKWKFRYVDASEKLYRCNKCGRVYSFSIKGLCSELKCDGALETINKSDIVDEPYYTNLFSDNRIIPMVSKEHTAQLASKTAGEYQKNFEEGKINVLSCSTTFEMGVDVGELEATFQRNVPPETSNYIQRAGRAGRRTSSAAFSVTFSRRTSHDMTFFNDPAEIIAGKIEPPVLEIGNEKIAERHLNSIVVSWFFKKHPEYFSGRAKQIVSFGSSKNMTIDLKSELEQHPDELLLSIKKVMPRDVFDSLGVDQWKFIDDVVGEEGTLTRAIAERSADIEGLKKFSSDARSGELDDGSINKMLSRAITAEKLVSTLEDEPSISFLSAKGVLPKYGFPIDTVSLDILGGSDEEAKKIDLSRDLRMAISEFAPPAKIVANGKVWESYAINTIPNKGWPAYIYHECPKCKKIYHPEGTMIDVSANLEEEPKKVCDYCGTLMNPRMFIIPLFGFSTQMEYVPKMVGETKPSSYYATHTQFWGIEDRTEKQKAEARDKQVIYKGKKVDITYSPGGKLFVLNQGTNGRGLRVCPSCGFSYDPTTVIKEKAHDTKFKKRCGNKNLITVSLGHEFSTDILKITLPSYESKLKMPIGMPPKNQFVSVLYAILEGASKSLGISRDDINGCITEKQEIVLFDDTAGGSGFVKHIYNNFDRVLIAARNKVSGNCGCTPETSCYGCLRNYSNQYYHDDMSRGLAYEYIDWLINSSDVVSVAKDTEDGKAHQEEIVGTKKLEYDIPDVSMNPDSYSTLESQMKLAEDDSIVEGYKRLAEAIKGMNSENPITCRKLPAIERDIWPTVFWAKSQVALFTDAQMNQYKILKKYNWYCYIVNREIDADLVVSHILRGE